MLDDWKAQFDYIGNGDAVADEADCECEDPYAGAFCPHSC